MNNRFCRDGMIAVGLNPNESKLALDMKYTTQNRMVFCDCSKHNCTILVDSSGQEVAPGERLVVPQFETLRAGHSLTR